MASSVSNLLTSIIDKILSGGRRTTADNTRQILSDITNSNLNLVDGGVVQGPVELQRPMIITDDAGVRRVVKYDNFGTPYTEKI